VLGKIISALLEHPDYPNQGERVSHGLVSYVKDYAEVVIAIDPVMKAQLTDPQVGEGANP